MGAPGDLRVGVDRVAEVDVEVVVLGHHRPEGLEVPIGRIGSPGLLVAGLVAREREPDRRAEVGRRSGLEPAHGAAAASARNAEAVVVVAVGLEPGEPGLDRVVVAGDRPQDPPFDHVLEGAVDGDLGLNVTLVGGATPDDRSVVADLAGGHPAGELLSHRRGRQAQGQPPSQPRRLLPDDRRLLPTNMESSRNRSSKIDDCSPLERDTLESAGLCSGHRAEP